MPENADTENTKQKIQRWLLEDGYKLESQPDPNALFKYVVTDVMGVRSVIVQPALTTDQIIIASGVNFDSNQQTLIQDLENKDRWDFLWDLRFGLLKLGVGFTGIALPLVNIEISKPIHYDGLTKDAFLQRIAQVKSGVLFTMWSFDRKFGATKPKADLMVR